MKRTSDWVSLEVPVDALLKMQGETPVTADIRAIYVGGMVAMMARHAKIDFDLLEREGETTIWFPDTITRYHFQRAVEWYKRCLTPEAPAHFNCLSPAEDERLAKLAEECAEVVKACMKIMRHGYDRYNPDVRGALEESNREHLQCELLDVLIAVARMSKNGDIEIATDEVEVALRTSGRYMHHQEAT
jgi:NTP pyrophosphatase (non-canonical NTP hydrolase)